MRVLYWITILVLAGSLVVEKKAKTNIWNLAEDLSGRLARNVRAEVALGKQANRYFEGVLQTQLPGQDSVFHLIWVVNPETCDDCFRFSDPWEKLGSDPLIERTLIVEGSPDSMPSTTVESLSSKGARLKTVSLGFLADRFDYGFQSLKLLISPIGEIVLVDGRPPNAQCRWSFEALVARYVRSPVSVPFEVPHEVPPGM